MWMMMIYLTDVWKLDYTHAAANINVWMGSVLLLLLPLSHLADAFLGNFCLFLLTTLSYTIGLGLLWMSTPPVLAKSYGNCTAYKPECIGDHQKALFYAGLALIAMGMAGHATFLGPFTVEQIDDGMQDNEDNAGCLSGSCFCIGGFAVVLIPIAGIIAVAFIKPWAILFGICARFAIVSTSVFLGGVCSYNYVRAQGSPVTTMFRMTYPGPRNVNDLYEGQGLSQIDSLPYTKGLSCNCTTQQSLQQQKQNRWRLCSVMEVEETKIAIHMIPMWLTFILCGVVSATGSTCFLEQAKHLDRKVGRIKVPLVVLLWFYEQGTQFFSKLYVMVSSCFGDSDSDSDSDSRRHLLP
ncbi:hypothetical protein Cgig2_031308 [Carnegiea gigantea]|uniref:Uncharacterized protein n=1 Tax=Carnegiea gigantea TaxID=171969 RepID=A0A9Q1KM63_9CARY|nr:hypothetical protein Cgig2_031308 [Carnegiea gigantea]